jgi:hypothetical protein
METLDITQTLHTVADELPANAAFHDVLEQMYLLSKVENALKQYQRGETRSHADIQSKVAEWLKSFGVNKRLVVFVLALFLLSSCAVKNITTTQNTVAQDAACNADWHDGKCANYPDIYHFIPILSEPKPDSLLLQKRIKQIFPLASTITGKINVRMFTTAKDSLVKAVFIESSDSELFMKPVLEAAQYLRSLPAVDYNNKLVDCWASFPIYFPIK